MDVIDEGSGGRLAMATLAMSSRIYLVGSRLWMQQVHHVVSRRSVSSSPLVSYMYNIYCTVET